MLDRLFGAVARLTPVHVAQTEAEQNAVFRMRYDIYVGEKNELGVPHADHARHEIRTPEDSLPDATIMYTGTPERVTGSLRVRVWGPGEIPADVRRRYSLSRFPDIDTRSICQVGHLMMVPTLRGTAAVVALTSSAVEKTVTEHGVEMMIADCAPGLLDTYRHLGLRPYGGQLLSKTRGMQIPVVGITADLDHARRSGSPWLAVLRRLDADGKLPRRDFSGLLAPLGESGVETDSARVLVAVEGAVKRHPSAFLARLPAPTRQRLARGGLVLDVAADTEMLVEGFASRDLFVVLEGEVEVLSNGVPIATVGPGEVLGEVAFFRANGQRSAAVRARTASRVLHLRHRFVKRMTHEQLADGVAVYEALANVLAERFAGAIAASAPSLSERPSP
jgi:CRP-like cAMP-binding protein